MSNSGGGGVTHIQSQQGMEIRLVLTPGGGGGGGLKWVR